MKKKYVLMIFSFLVIMLLGLVTTGFMFNKTEEEKTNGLSNHYDVSANGTIAYVTYEDGKPSLRLFHEEKATEQTVLTLEPDKNILDPSFTKDGKKLAFIVSHKNKEEQLDSRIELLDMQTLKTTKLLDTSTVITEVDFSSTGKSLFYLSAGTFENYSPITGKRPHNFDIYKYDFDAKTEKRITFMKKYSMTSLRVSPDEQSVFVQMDDDADVKTAEDTFEAHQRIFQIPLQSPAQPTVVTDPDREVDIFDFTFTPAGDEIIFQSISNADSGDTFIYELYRYHMKNKTETQLTNLGEYTDHPVVSADGKMIYFTVDKRFAKGDPDYHLYSMTLDGKNTREIGLPIK